MKIPKYEKIKTESENVPRLFELWNQIINGSEEENKKEAGK